MEFNYSAGGTWTFRWLAQCVSNIHALSVSILCMQFLQDNANIFLKLHRYLNYVHTDDLIKSSFCTLFPYERALFIKNYGSCCHCCTPR